MHKVCSTCIMTATVTHVTGDASHHQRHLQMISVLTVQIVKPLGEKKPNNLTTNWKKCTILVLTTEAKLVRKLKCIRKIYFTKAIALDPTIPAVTTYKKRVSKLGQVREYRERHKNHM